ncbi:MULTISPECIES: hypothetical protein [unclassified Streptomyces]|uniref:hypothetical protein n=1 Tax=unclassified Streptomyces TaxID=2593676 RepID=UPI000DDAFE1C|nr:MULTISPECIES: hypothetical protein [unclassified Streptomyces]QZZ26578.1 hypothetical protein A7X85_10190 [Streptomyces sp. ST1015]
MTARDWLYERLTGAPVPPDEATTGLDAYRAQVFAEAAVLVEHAACDADFTEDPLFIAGLRAAGGLLTKPDFFEPGHTYRAAAWEFRCDTITHHPKTSERTALGWLRRGTSDWTAWAYSAADWGSEWADITTAVTE